MVAAAAAAVAPPPLKSTSSKKSPSKKKQVKNVKATMPEFPESVVDEQGRRFMRDVQLGQGGFARVYRVYGPDGVPHAFKCISKASLTSKKNRAKMLAEMKIHRMLRHPNIVRYDEAFDDENNIYLKLELCSVGNMNDISKRRGGFTEAEARFWMVQILAGCQYMHISNVIHRDLKLGNIFLDSKMNVKIGDFGLAALLNFPSERKKTMCGTPNYIAPEILNEAGHSFEVDVWAVGVILYTLLVGKPPFQTNDVHGIYENIKRNYYQFPDRTSISPEGKALVRRILTSNPADRPSLIDIMADPWFQAGPIPMSVPTSAVRGEPLNIILPTNLPSSMRNFEAIKASAGFRDDADDELPEEQVVAREGPKRSAREERREQERVEEERDRVTREFNEAIQPDAPWSLLLKAGRDPLVRAPTFSSQPSTTTAASTRSMPSLVKQLSALNIHRQAANGVAKAQGDHGMDKENAGPGHATQHASHGKMGPPSLLQSGRGAALLGGTAESGGLAGGDAMSAEERRMIGQKARLVAGMTAGSAVSVTSIESAGASRRATAKGAPSGGATDAESEAEAGAAGASALTTTSSSTRRMASNANAKGAKRSMSSVETIVQNVGDALAALDARQEYFALGEDGTPLEIPLEEVDDVDNGTRLRPVHPSVVIISWLDHSEKYGLGYALSDGSVGVHFRDSTSMSFNANRSHFDYISQLRSRSGSNALTAPSTVAPRDQLKRDNFPLPEAQSDVEWAREAVGREVAQKLKIMRFFEAEIMERLFGAENPLAWNDEKTTSGMTFVHKWYRCKLAIVFRLSTGTIQFNFYDHYKLFLSRDGQVISCIEPVDKTDGLPIMRSWTLSELISIADLSRSEREAAAAQAEAEAEARGEEGLNGINGLVRTRPGERKLARSLVKKLRYARDVLVNTLSARANVVGASAAAAKAAAGSAASNSRATTTEAS